MTITEQDLINTVNTVKDALGTVHQRITDMETKNNRPDLFGGGGYSVKTIGAQFTESDAYKRYVAGGMVGHSEAVKALTSGGLGLGMYTPDIVRDRAGEPFTLRDLLRVQQIDAPSVTYLTSIFENNAAIAPEGTLKGESNMSLTEKTVTAMVIAHFLTVSRQAMQDVVGIKQFIDTTLIAGHDKVLETQLLYGAGTTDQFMGLMASSDVPTAGNRGPAGSPISMLDIVRKAITKVRQAGYTPNGICMAPADFEAIELSKGEDGHYLGFVNVGNGTAPRLWGLPVVQSSTMVSNEFIVGDFNTGATLFQREGLSVRVSEHSGDDFVHNLLKVLVESRSVLGITAPKALCKGSFATT